MIHLKLSFESGNHNYKLSINHFLLRQEEENQLTFLNKLELTELDYLKDLELYKIGFNTLDIRNLEINKDKYFDFKLIEKKYYELIQVYLT